MLNQYLKGIAMNANRAKIISIVIFCDVFNFFTSVAVGRAGLQAEVVVMEWVQPLQLL